MTYKEALDWCFTYLAQVTFFIEQGQRRCTVRASGFPSNTATRNSFTEAVEAVKAFVDRVEAQNKDE